MRGLLIAIEGGHGSGKTTQQKMLGDFLVRRGYRVLLTIQPTLFYREDPRVRKFFQDNRPDDAGVLTLLSAADRLWHVRVEIEPAVCLGIIVISNRYVYSAIAHHSVRGVDPSYVKELNGRIPIPDITIFLDVPSSLARARVVRRGGSDLKQEEMDINFLDSTREAFLKALPANALILDGTRGKKIIHHQIVDAVTPLLKPNDRQ